MAQELKFRRGTTAQNSVFTGAEAELSYDTEKKSIVTHDGSTVGGFTGGGFLQSGAGATPRSVEEKLRERRSVKDFGALGDNVTDDSDAIQAAIDFGDGIVFLPKGNYKIEKPLYLRQRVILQGEGDSTVIIKSGTTVGSGTNVSPSIGSVTDSYAVDAVIIVPHADGLFTYYTGLYDIRLQGDGAFTTSYGVYAPRLSQCIFQNVRIRFCITGFYTNDTWMTSFDRVTIDAEKMRPPLSTEKGVSQSGPTAFCRGFHWAVDGGGGGTGTSIVFNDCYVRRVDRGFDITGLSYSNIFSCGADQMNVTAYKFQSCKSLNLSGCAMEDSMMDPGIEFSGGNYNVTGFNTYKNYGVSGKVAYRAISAAKVVFIGSLIENFYTVNGALNKEISGGSEVSEIDSSFPTNGNSYVSYSSGAKLKQFRADDIVFTDSTVSVGTKKSKGRQHFSSNDTILSAGTDIATITFTGSGNSDYLAGKIKIVHEDSPYPNGIGYIEVPFVVYRTSTSYFSNVGSSISSIAGNGYSTQPTISFTRSGNVWTMKVTPAHGDMTAILTEVETHTNTDGSATFELLI